MAPSDSISIASVSIELTPKPTAMMLICGSVRPISPSTIVDRNNAIISGAAAWMPSEKLWVMSSVKAST